MLLSAKILAKKIPESARTKIKILQLVDNDYLMSTWFNDESKMMQQWKFWKSMAGDYESLLDCSEEDERAIRAQEEDIFADWIGKVLTVNSNFFHGAGLDLTTGEGHWMKAVMRHFKHADAHDFIQRYTKGVRRFYSGTIQNLKIDGEYDLIIAAHSFGFMNVD